MFIQIDEVFKSRVKGFKGKWFEGNQEVGSILYINGKPFVVIAKQDEIDEEVQSYTNVK